MRRSRTSSPFATTPPTLRRKAGCTSSSSTGSTPCSTTLSRHPAEQHQQEVEFRCDGHPGPGQSISRDRSFQADGAAQLVGDTNPGLKWKFHKEFPDSRLLAFSATFYCEFPTGGTSRQLSSGVVDYWLKGIVQKNTISPDEDHRQQQRGRVYTEGSRWFENSRSAWARNGSSQVQFLGGRQPRTAEGLGLRFRCIGWQMRCKSYRGGTNRHLRRVFRFRQFQRWFQIVFKARERGELIR